MASFQDRDKRTWEVVISVADVANVRKKLGIDLAALADNKLQQLAELLSDPCRLVDVLYVLCECQVKALGLTEEDFGRIFSGDIIAFATDAFVSAFADYQRNPKLRRQIREIWEYARKVEDRMLAQSAAMIASIDPEAEAQKIIAGIVAKHGVQAAALKLADCAE
jgi:hypothetical protein